MIKQIQFSTADQSLISVGGPWWRGFIPGDKTLMTCTITGIRAINCDMFLCIPTTWQGIDGTFVQFAVNYLQPRARERAFIVNYLSNKNLSGSLSLQATALQPENITTEKAYTFSESEVEQVIKDFEGNFEESYFSSANQRF